MKTQTRPIYGPRELPPNSWWNPLLRSLHKQGLPAEHWFYGWRVTVGRLVARYRLHPNFRYGKRAVLHPTAWASSGWLFPRGLWNEPVVLAMDCWGSQWDDWEKLLRRTRVRVAGFTARDSEAEMKRRLPHLQTRWIPEAIEHHLYEPGPPLSERSIDLLEMGRLYSAFHDAVTDAFADAGKKHVYPKPGQHYMFKDHAEIRATLADTRLMVCYPRCDTNPEQAGPVETLTLRYLEGFVSGCLVVGRTPRELIDLFGYDPVVPLDVTLPPDQLAAEALSLLDRLDEFQPLVEKNREHAVRLADWDQRAHDVLDWLKSLGYTTKTDTA